MSTGSFALQQPICDAQPCGEDLEDTQLLASFDAFRIFGQQAPLTSETDWRDLRDKSLEALAKAKDLRLLAHYAAAAVRTDGLPEFFATLQIVRQWLATYWDEVYPRIDDDAVLRKNALSAFADRMAVVDAIRRVPVIVNRQLGAFSLRDIDIATGQLPATGQDTQPPTPAQIEAALEATPLEQVTQLEQQVTGAIGALTETAETMRSRGGPDASPDFEPLVALLSRLAKYLQSHLAIRSPQAGAGAAESAGATGDGAQTVAVGAIKTRQDAVLALDTIAAFFRKNEPSSPVPLLLERAKRLVSKSFLEVLEDMAPDGIAQARLISGIRGDAE